ncbi:MAG: undecaprenyl-diphosphate phosphatase [Lentisphaerae bacterium]|nr:undecaprenyl-diphosphate phosphatase [Lentisphaerota bacterium]
MHDWVSVLILAVVQGVTEFLPVSSSAHLLIGKELLGLNAPGVHLEVVLHLGTLMAVVAFYRNRLADLVMGVLTGSRAAWLMGGLLALSSVPAIGIWIVFGDRLDALFGNQRQTAVVASWLLLVTGGLLFSVRFARRADGGPMTVWRAWWIGCMQAMALLPGISRSGSTITVARHLGVRPDQAAEFSFLMSIPVLIGAVAVDFLQEGPTASGAALGTAHYIVGACVAAGVGYAAIGLLVRLLCRDRFWHCAVYCLCAGAASLGWLAHGR